MSAFASFKLDPKRDLQEQLRPSLHVKMSTLMRPDLQRSTETSTPTTLCSTPKEVRRRRQSFIPLDPTEFRALKAEQEQKTSFKGGTTNNQKNKTRRSSVVVNLSVNSPSSSSSTNNKNRKMNKRNDSPPVFDRLASPLNFTGVYRRRSILPDGTPTKDKSMNQSTEMSLHHLHQKGKVFTGGNNIKTDAVVSDIKELMRPNLRTDKSQPHSTNFAYSNHEVKRRAAFSKKYRQVLLKQKEQQAQKKKQQETNNLKKHVPQKMMKNNQQDLCSGSANSQRNNFSLGDFKGSVFDRLSDPGTFKGHHQHRFDSITGKGKGLIGRSLPSKGFGHVDQSQRVHVLLRPQTNKKYTMKKKVSNGDFVTSTLGNYNGVRDAAMKEVRESDVGKELWDEGSKIDLWLDEKVLKAEKMSGVGGKAQMKRLENDVTSLSWTPPLLDEW